MNAEPVPAPMKGKGYPQIVVNGNSQKEPLFYYIRIENLVFPVSINVYETLHFKFIFMY